MSAALNLDSIFAAAIELPTHMDRDSYIARACGQDDALRRRIGQLVAAHFEAGDFLERTNLALADTVEPVTQEGPGTIVGGGQSTVGTGR